MDEKIKEAAKMIKEANNIVVFTGAGISTESGLPDFRSPGGIWEKYDPNEFVYDRIVYEPAIRKKYWAFAKSFWPVLKKVEPNPAHIGIAELEKLGKLSFVITQNIDGLHQKAGTSPEKVVELHGTAMFIKCIECKSRYPSEQIYDMCEKEGIDVPKCPKCGGILKPATISFGEAMPEKELSLSFDAAKRCDLMIVVGSSLVVYPAAHVPYIAKEHGAKLIIINLSSTPLDNQADLIFRDKAAKVIPKILEEVKKIT